MSRMKELEIEVIEEAERQYKEGNIRWDQTSAYHGLSRPVVKDADFIDEILKRNGIVYDTSKDDADPWQDQEYVDLQSDLLDAADHKYQELFEEEMDERSEQSNS